MKVSELIDALMQDSQLVDVYVWVDGERYPVTMVDNSFVEQGFIELNVNTGETE